jgi:hypothetical protein
MKRRSQKGLTMSALMCAPAAFAFGFLVCTTAGVAQVRDLPNIQMPQAAPRIDRVPDLRVPEGVRVPEAAQAAPSPAQAANGIHRDSSGKWVPDNGCHWLNNDPDDLRVRCD